MASDSRLATASRVVCGAEAELGTDEVGRCPAARP